MTSAVKSMGKNVADGSIHSSNCCQTEKAPVNSASSPDHHTYLLLSLYSKYVYFPRHHKFNFILKASLPTKVDFLKLFASQQFQTTSFRSPPPPLTNANKKHLSKVHSFLANRQTESPEIKVIHPCNSNKFTSKRILFFTANKLEASVY